VLEDLPKPPHLFANSTGRKDNFLNVRAIDPHQRGTVRAPRIPVPQVNHPPVTVHRREHPLRCLQQLRHSLDARNAGKTPVLQPLNAEAGDPGLDGLPLQPFTEATIVDPEKLIEHLRAVQLHGYAIDSEEFAAGLCCVAAPVRDGNARVIAALSLSGPSARFSEERLHGEAASAIMTAATGLSRELGSPL